MVAPLLTSIRTNNLYEWMATELAGNATPKVVTVRSKAEMLDEALTQYGGDLLFVGGAVAISKALPAIYKKAGISLSGEAKAWFIATNSIASLGYLACGYLALPFLRNAITLKATGTRNYAEMIGEHKKQKQDEQALHQEMNKYLKTALLPLSIAGSLIVGSAILMAVASKKQWKAPEFVHWFNDHLGLKDKRFAGQFDGDFSAIPRVSRFLFWGAAAYTAYGLAATDNHERYEVALKAAAFTLGFEVMPKLVEPLIEKKIAEACADGWKIPAFIGDKENLEFVCKYIVSVITLGLLPPALNIYLTHQRVLKEQQKTPPQPIASSPSLLAVSA
jgi:hypothetical protein